MTHDYSKLQKRTNENNLEKNAEVASRYPGSGWHLAAVLLIVQVYDYSEANHWGNFKLKKSSRPLCLIILNMFIYFCENHYTHHPYLLARDSLAQTLRGFRGLAAPAGPVGRSPWSRAPLQHGRGQADHDHC